MNKRCIIIGSGPGGLASGIILARNGYEVTVLEQSFQVGGCLQCFSRKGVKFETGMHFIGSADEHQTLARLFDFLDIRDRIKLSRLDTSGYDQVALYGQLFRFPNGKEAFIEQMASYFPKEKDNLLKYYKLVQTIADASVLHSMNNDKSDWTVNTEYQTRSINEVIESLIKDPLLQKVLVGNLPLYAAERDKTPFSTHAFIMDFYNQSAFRIVGGSDSIARALKRVLESLGGQVLTRQKVVKIICDDTKALGVETGNEDFFPADYIISAVHPQRLMEMLDTKMIRPVFRQRIQSMSNTTGVFSLYLQFHDNAVPYRNNNFYAYTDSPWNCEQYTADSWPEGYLYMHLAHEDKPQYAKTGVVLSYMNMQELKGWENTSVGERGDEYEAFKKQKAGILLHAMEKQFPGLKSRVANYYTSTPLTYRDYTGTQDGAIYGVAKDVTLGVASRVPHKTKIPNLFLTGQNINSHGMLGVLVGAIVTCGELVGVENIYKQINETNQ